MIQATAPLITAIRAAHDAVGDTGITLGDLDQVVGIVAALVSTLMLTVGAFIIWLIRRLNRLENTLIEVRVRLDEHLEVGRGNRSRR